MSFVDIVIVVLIIWFGYRGLNNGLIKELSGIIAIGLGIFFALKFSKTAKKLLLDFEIASTEYLTLICFALIFVLVVFLSFLLTGFLQKTIKIIRMNWLNKIAGLIFGIFKIALILSVCFFFLSQLNYLIFDGNKVLFENSILYKPLSEMIDNLYPHIELLRFQPYS